MICDSSIGFRYFVVVLSDLHCCDADYVDFAGMRCSVSAGQLDAVVYARGRFVALHTWFAIALVSSPTAA